MLVDFLCMKIWISGPGYKLYFNIISKVSRRPPLTHGSQLWGFDMLLSWESGILLQSTFQVQLWWNNPHNTLFLSGNRWVAVWCSMPHRRPPATLSEQQSCRGWLGQGPWEGSQSSGKVPASCPSGVETFHVIAHSQRKLSTLCIDACGNSGCLENPRPACTVFFFFSVLLLRGSQQRTPIAKRPLCPGWKGCCERIRSLGEGESCQAVKNGISVGWPEIGL